MIKQNGRNVDTMDLYIKQERKPLIDHAKISQAKPRKSTRPTGFTLNNLKDGAAKLGSIYKKVGKRIYGGKLPKSKVMQAFTKIVCEYFGIENDRIMQKNKKRDLVMARQIIYYFAKKEGLTFKDCAEYFNQDHTTVIWSVESVTKEMAVNKEFRSMINEIENKIR